ncbi:P-loop NTPase family protein [Paraburkholderia domus]|uniref:hypothetical protein n=1 Tax=Paraburkholderia domus TaxID=2793075 RepID=UPI001B2EC09C|nr:hypothetical protein [Paraburkholderia domus]CAE6696473.1 hypothetical protein R75483_00617 [Paraburkholderia domus]
MTFSFPPNRSTLSLWDIACRLTGQNATDEKPTNETRDKLAELAEAVYGNNLWVRFHPDAGFDFVRGFMPAARHARIETDWRKLDHVTVDREDWARYKEKLATTDAVTPADIEQAESTLAQPQAPHVSKMVEFIANGEPIDWDYWAGKMPRWTAYQAVRLMAALDPVKHPKLSFKRNETSGAAKEQATRLETLAASHGMTEASPLDWLNWADKLAEPVHGGFRAAVEKLPVGRFVPEISKAPAPIITPLPGGSSGFHHRPATTAKPPDWSLWRHMPEVCVWQACALSLNIDPDSMQQTRHGWMAGPGKGPFFEPESFPSDAVMNEFHKRVRILSASLPNHALISGGTSNFDSKARCMVRLSEFARFAIEVAQWDVPDELRAVVGKSDSHPVDASDRMPTESAVWATQFNSGREVDWERAGQHRTIEARKAILWMHGLEPEVHSTKPEAPIRLRSNPQATEFFDTVRHVLAVAESAGMQPCTAAEWVAWANSKGFSVHSEFRRVAEASCSSGSVAPIAGNVTDTPAPEAGNGDVTATSPAPGVTLHTLKSRSNLLTPRIQKVVTDTGSYDSNVVFPLLREMAIREEVPLNGVDNNDGALLWTDANGKPKRLTKKALSERLRNLRKQGKAG